MQLISDKAKYELRYYGFRVYSPAYNAIQEKNHNYELFNQCTKMIYFI